MPLDQIIPWYSCPLPLAPDQIILRYLRRPGIRAPPRSDHHQIFAPSGSNHRHISNPQIKSSPDIRAPWIRSSPDHPRRPRDSQKGREKRPDERFQAQAEELLGTDSQTIYKRLSECWLLIGHKKMLCIIVPNRRTESPGFLFTTTRSNHPQIFVPPPDHIIQIFVTPDEVFGTHLFISWWLEPNFH